MILNKNSPFYRQLEALSIVDDLLGWYSVFDLCKVERSDKAGLQSR